MVAALLATSSTLLTMHSTVGCSTGYMDELREDWDALVEEAAATSGFAVELSALSEEELPGLIAYLGGAPALPFRFVSVHGPSKHRELSDEALVALLEQLPPRVSAIVMHPDAMYSLEPYRRLGRRLCIENMDPRKGVGQSVEDLQACFEILPEARLCFDIAHAKAVDPSMDLARELLARFSCRLSHVHLSSLDADQGHVPLTDSDQALFADVLERCCSDVPWILEAPPV
jgi:hypothetical protein